MFVIGFSLGFVGGSNFCFMYVFAYCGISGFRF